MILGPVVLPQPRILPPEISERQHVLCLLGIKRRDRVGDVAVFVHVVHPRARDFLQDTNRKNTRTREGRLDLIQKPRNFIQIVFGDLDKRGKKLKKAGKVVAGGKAHVLQAREIAGSLIAVFVHLPLQADCLFGHYLDAVPVVLISDKPPRSAGGGIQEIHRHAGKRDIGQHRNCRVVIRLVEDFHSRFTKPRVDIQLGVNLCAAPKRVVIGGARNPVGTDAQHLADAPVFRQPEGIDERRVVREGQRPPLEYIIIGLAFDDRPIGR